MVELFLDNIYLAMLLPLWIFLIIMVGRFFSVYVNKFILYILTLFSSAFGAILSLCALWKLPQDMIFDVSYPFIKINDYVIEWGLHIDKTALIFATVLFLVSFFVQLFSISYMEKEKRNYRFYALMNLFNFSMLGLFFSPNLFQTYLFWEIVGVVSYLLIGFEYSKFEKSLASKKAFIMNRIGDTALIGAIITCSYFIYSYAPNKSLATLSFVDMNTISTIVSAYASSPLFEIICGLFMLAALVKSAQFIFFTWLQDAMEAKLPVSSLLHSATLVAAGIFLTLRLMPFYTLEDILLKSIAILGILTALVCSISATAQDNPKKVLAYSTSAQLGLVYFALGALNIKAALILFVAHAFIKSMLFILLPKENEKWNYFKFVIFLIGGLSLSGLILSGMVAKEFFATSLGNTGTIIVSILSFLTAFYIIRIALRIFEIQGVEKIRPKTLELIASLGLFVLNIVFYIYLHFTCKYSVAEPFWAALTAWICVYVLYLKSAFWKVPILYPIAKNGFYLDKFYMTICAKAYGCIANICNFIDTKLFANYKPVLVLAKGSVKLFSFVENKIMNGALNTLVRLFRKISYIDLRAQDGNIQRYNIYAFIIITLILVCLIFGYMTILVYIGGING